MEIEVLKKGIEIDSKLNEIVAIDFEKTKSIQSGISRLEESKLIDAESKASILTILQNTFSQELEKLSANYQKQLAEL